MPDQSTASNTGDIDRPSIRRVTAVVNAASGSVGPQAADALRQMLEGRDI